MIKEAIEKILSMAPTEKFEFGGTDFTSKQLFSVKQPKPETRGDISINTLNGICSWMRSIDGETDVIVHITGPKNVLVYSETEEQYFLRHQYVNCNAIVDTFDFGKFMSIEQFVIDASCKFVMTDELKKVIKIVSNIRAENVLAVEDDGISQKVTASNKIGRIETVQMDPFVHLEPNRTFNEVEQPIGRFLIRAKQREGQLPVIALFEADNAVWKLQAMDNIRTFLAANLPDEFDRKNIIM